MKKALGADFKDVMAVVVAMPNVSATLSTVSTLKRGDAFRELVGLVHAGNLHRFMNYALTSVLDKGGMDDVKTKFIINFATYALQVNRDAIAADEAFLRQAGAAASPLYRFGYYPHNVHFLLVAAVNSGSDTLSGFHDISTICNRSIRSIRRISGRK